MHKVAPRRQVGNLSDRRGNSNPHMRALYFSVVTLALASARLARDGSWRGCVLSASWCTGPGELASADAGWLRTLMQGSVAGIALANMMTLPMRGASCPWRAASALAHVGVFFAANVPMSCAALVDGVGWSYVGWNDVGHDIALAVVLCAAAAARWLAPPPPAGAGAVRLAGLPTRTLVGWVASFSAPCAIYGLFACPTLQLARSKLCVLCAEVAALFAAQVAHTLTCVELERSAGHHETLKTAR